MTKSAGIASRQQDASYFQNEECEFREFRGTGWPCVRKLQNAGRALHSFLNKDDAAAKATTDAENSSPSKGIDFAGETDAALSGYFDSI